MPSVLCLVSFMFDVLLLDPIDIIDLVINPTDGAKVIEDAVRLGIKNIYLQVAITSHD